VVVVTGGRCSYIVMQLNDQWACAQTVNSPGAAPAVIDQGCKGEVRAAEVVVIYRSTKQT
jgi:hypothetical protein